MTQPIEYAPVSPVAAPTLLADKLGGSMGLRVLLAIGGIALLAASSKVQVPMWPVPVTMQTLVVLLIGMAYGPRLGVATVLGYLAVGFAGLPVFANGGGPGYVFSPTVGYLASYPFAAGLVGYLATRGWDRSFALTLLANVIGTAVIFAIGVSYLAAYLGDPAAAVTGGLVLFLPGAVLKVLLAAALLPTAWQVLGRQR